MRKQMMALWIALLPHSMKVLGSIPSWGRAFLCGVYMFSLCLHGFSPGTLVSPATKLCTSRYNSPDNAFDRGTVQQLCVTACVTIKTSSSSSMHSGCLLALKGIKTHSGKKH